MRLPRLAGSAATLGILVLMTVLSACSGGAPRSPGQAAPQPPSAASTTPAPTAAPTTPALTRTTPAPPPVTRSYDAARAQWRAGATATSADQGRYWSNAANDLTVGETTDSDPTGYADAVAMLDELVSLPDAQQTAAQNAAYHHDIDALNAFFHTPGLYG